MKRKTARKATRKRPVVRKRSLFDKCQEANYMHSMRMKAELSGALAQVEQVKQHFASTVDRLRFDITKRVADMEARVSGIELAVSDLNARRRVFGVDPLGGGCAASV